MIFIKAVILPIVLGLIKGGSIKKIKKLENIELKGIPLLFIPLIIRQTSYHASQGGVEFFIEYGGYLQILAFGLLLGFFALNWHTKGLKIVFTGVVMNALVIFTNGGVMPVSKNALQIAGISKTPLGTHAFLNTDTAFPFLADIIPLPPPYPFNTVISPGDILIIVGVFLLIYNTLVYEDI